MLITTIRKTSRLYATTKKCMRTKEVAEFLTEEVQFRAAPHVPRVRGFKTNPLSLALSGRNFSLQAGLVLVLSTLLQALWTFNLEWRGIGAQLPEVPVKGLLRARRPRRGDGKRKATRKTTAMPRPIQARLGGNCKMRCTNIEV